MSNLKKILALALVFAMAFTMAAGALSYPTGGYMDNDEISAKTLDSIKELGDLGVMNGTPGSVEAADGTVTQGMKFMPNESLTRAQFARMIYSIETGKDNADLFKNVATGFKDVDKASWYAGFVGYAWLNGWVSGKSKTVFDPEGEITLAEAATLICAYLGFNKADLAAGWPNNPILYGSMKGLFNNGADQLGMKEELPRQWAAVVIVNMLNTKFVAKDKDTGLYADVGTDTVRAARFGNYKTITGVLVANNNYSLDSAVTKTDNSNKFKVKTATETIEFSKEFNAADEKFFTDTAATAALINLGDAYLGMTVTLSYLKTTAGNVINKYAVDSKCKTAVVANADVKFSTANDKITLGTLQAERAIDAAEIAAIKYYINGKAYSAADLGLDVAATAIANFKAMVAAFPANTTFSYTLNKDSKIATLFITYFTFDKIADITITETAAATPADPVVKTVTKIKIGSTEYTKIGAAASSLKKDDYVVFYVNDLTGNVHVTLVAPPADTKVEYVTFKSTDNTIMIKEGTAASKKLALVPSGNVTIAGKTFVFNTTSASSNGKQWIDAARDATTYPNIANDPAVNGVLALAGKEVTVYQNGGVFYSVALKTAATATKAFYLSGAPVVQVFGADKNTIIYKGFVDGAATTYTLENVKDTDVSGKIVAADSFYTATLTDGKFSGLAVVTNGFYGTIETTPADDTEFKADTANKTLTDGDTPVNTYVYSGAKIYGFSGEEAKTTTDFGTGKKVAMTATQVGSTTTYIVSAIYIQQ